MKLLSRIMFVGMGAGFLVGCQQDGRRVSLHDDAPGELRLNQMPTRDLIEASDRVAEKFAGEINRMARDDWDGYRVTMYMGDIQNKTGTMRTDDFELVQQRIKSKLMGSDLFRDNVKVRADKRRIDDLNRRQGVGGQDDDPMQERSSRSNSSSPNPDYTFYLNGDAIGVHRGGNVHLYYLVFTLTRASDHEQIFDGRYEMKFDNRR